MSDLLESAFGLVCGQDSHRAWTSGGETMPLCARCTGIYVGALLGLALWGSWRPRATGALHALHALFILQIVPAGLHLFDQGALLRTLSGALFGVGLGFALWQLRGVASRGDGRGRAIGYGLSVAVGIGLLIGALRVGGGTIVLEALAWMALAGLVSAIAVLAVTLAVTICTSVRRVWGPRRSAQGAPRAAADRPGRGS